MNVKLDQHMMWVVQCRNYHEASEALASSLMISVKKKMQYAHGTTKKEAEAKLVKIRRQESGTPGYGVGMAK